MEYKNTIKSLLLVPSCLLVCSVLLIASGCSTIALTANSPLPDAQITESAESAGVYEVHMNGQFSKAISFKGEIDGPITVQTALERSGAIDKFRGMEVTLMRVVKESGRGLKLPVEYQAGTQQVTSSQDYAIHPNDRIMVQSRSKNPLDQIVNSLSR
ncbi:MAG: hypothetical protein P8J27_08060 [Mariniblastus sp.]|nr:hypothetical protein [Mariniblastus sp.]